MLNSYRGHGFDLTAGTVVFLRPLRARRHLGTVMRDYACYGRLAAGVRLHDGKRDWKLRDPRKWFASQPAFGADPEPPSALDPNQPYEPPP